MQEGNRMVRKFHITRVVSKDFVSDWFENVRSLFGMRMRSYEENIQKNLDELFTEMENLGTVQWFRINQDVIDDGIILTVYGEVEQ